MIRDCVVCGKKIGTGRYYVKTTDDKYACQQCHTDSGLEYSVRGLTMMLSVCSDELKAIVNKNRSEGIKFGAPKFTKPKPVYDNSNDDVVRCPKCGSSQITAGNKGFGVGKAAAGVLLTGGIGLLAGGIGSKKTMITCLKCGYRWQAGKH